ncbi:MAG: iron-sulfur cluster assembly scaffold protein [Candidatus Marinimicrobia bacterium]|nr:iron-sulfur cluster assembly scaffold protein [Candidatus Neomarinimicrobiota bacterium]
MTRNPTDLYHSLIRDQACAPRNFGPAPPDWRVFHAENPACGDAFNLALDLDGGRIRAARFNGRGCAVSTAAFSVATELLTGEMLEDWQTRTEAIQRWLAGLTPFHPQWPDALRAFEAVRQFPSRVHCAALPWQALLKPQPGHTEAPS